MGGALIELVLTGRPSDYYKHIPLIPAVSAYVMYRRRRSLFRGEPGSPVLGGASIAAGLVLIAFDLALKPGLVGHVELVVMGAILFLAGSFLTLFGRRSFVRSLFPFLFLAFMVPLPVAWMERIVSGLVLGSMGVTHLLFKAAGVPFVQEGAIFRLPAFDIEVAQECSGIRSSIALLITSVLAGQIFLAGRWRKIALALAVIPVTILKNGDPDSPALSALVFYRYEDHTGRIPPQIGRIPLFWTGPGHARLCSLASEKSRRFPYSLGLTIVCRAPLALFLKAFLSTK